MTYLTELGGKLSKAWDFAKSHLVKSQDKMKKEYDKQVKDRDFKVGDQVLVLLPIPGSPLKAKYSGHWRIVKKLSKLDYVVETPTRRKTYQRCHVNMLKSYVSRDSNGIINPELLMSEEPVRSKNFPSITVRY